MTVKVIQRHFEGRDAALSLIKAQGMFARDGHIQSGDLEDIHWSSESQIVARSIQRWLSMGAACLLLFTTSALHADSERLTPEPDERAYNFVAHYRIVIDAPAAAVWPVLMDLKAWMYEFDLSTISGESGSVGQVLRLYANQAFMIQLTQIVPQQMLAVANLPSDFEGEHSTGVGLFSLHEHAGTTEVALTMSRRYIWMDEGANPNRQTRGSPEFQQRTADLWQKFLARLKLLVESSAT